MKIRTSPTMIALGATAFILTGSMTGSLFAKESEGSVSKGTITADAKMPGIKLAGMAKVSLASALDAATKKVSGKAVKAELEAEDGYLIYTVAIITPDGKVMEVNLDAANGKVLGVEDETAEAEAEFKAANKEDKD